MKWATIENSKFSLNKVERAACKRDFKGMLVWEKVKLIRFFFNSGIFSSGRKTSIVMCYKLAV